MSDITKSYPHNTIIKEIANDDYHAHKAISSSNCKDLLKSPWLYWYKKRNPSQQTAPMALGSMIHHLILEPETFDAHYMVAEIPKRTTKAGKAEYQELLEQANGRKLVALDNFLNAQEMRHNLGKNPVVCSLLSSGAAEQATFWQDEHTGVECKAKADFLNLEKGLIIDLKTTSDLASELCFKWTLNKYQYHLSAAFYQQGFKQALGKKCDFFFIVIETFKPHNYAIYKIGDDLLERGNHLCREALRVYKHAESRGSFEQPYHGGNLLELVA
jgi:exodeoxyribonuclease VIII